MRTLKLLLVLALLTFSEAPAWAQSPIQEFPEHHFKVQFGPGDWQVIEKTPDTVMFELEGASPGLVFAVVLVERPLHFDQQTAEERQGMACRALEARTEYRVLSIKDRPLGQWPGTLMYFQDADGTEHGFSQIVTTDRRTYMLTALTSAQAEELLKQQFAHILGTFDPLPISNTP